MGVYKGRHTADQNEEVTVFLIGMNINNWLFTNGCRLSLPCRR